MSADEVAPGLWVGDAASAQNTEFLTSQSISHIVSAVCGWTAQDVALQGRAHLLLRVQDDPEEDLLSQLPHIVRFVRTARRQSGRVLVHCESGMSRSVTVAAACLMDVDDSATTTTAAEAVAKIARRRPVAAPNAGFLQQLELWERMQGELEGTTSSHLAYRRIRNARVLQLEGSLPPSASLPSAATMRIREDADQPVAVVSYSCRSCRAQRFLETNCFHLCHHGYIAVAEPMAWMFERSGPGTATGGDGKVYCPCGTKVGVLALRDELACTSGCVDGRSYPPPTVRISLGKFDRNARSSSSAAADPHVAIRRT